MMFMIYYYKNLLSIFTSSFSMSVWKQICIVFIAVLSPYYYLFALLMGFVLIDLVTGIISSYKSLIRESYVNKKIRLPFVKGFGIFWRNIKSRKLRYTAEKLMVYMLLICVFSFFEYYFLNITIEGYTLTKLIVMLLSLIEIKSISENFDIILNKKYFSIIFNLFQKKVDKKIEGVFGSDIIDQIIYSGDTTNNI